MMVIEGVLFAFISASFSSSFFGRISSSRCRTISSISVMSGVVPIISSVFGPYSQRAAQGSFFESQ
jgi:hypothetical protein